MARIRLPGEPDRTSICVETRKGNPIDNQLNWDGLTEFYRSQVRYWEREYPPPEAYHGSVVSSVYNCHGLTFASRRTTIWDPNDIKRIIAEDDYEEVTPSDARAGDVVIYYANGDAEHSGVFIGIDKHGDKRILSKWGFGREVIHLYNRCPYDPATIKYFRVMR